MVKTISARELCSIYGDGSRIIDVRTPAEFAQSHIEGTENIPLGRFSERVINKQANDAVYLICGTGARASKAFELFSPASRSAITVVTEGVSACISHGLPEGRIEDSAGISLERQVRIAAGLLVVTGVVLGTSLTPAAYGLSAFVGAGLVFAGVTDTCGMAMVLARMPWNK